MMISVTACVLTAAGKLKWTLHAAWPLVVAATALHLILIPRAGSLGAAAVTAGLACVGAFVNLLLACRLWRTRIPAPTLVRAVAVSAFAYAAAALVPAPGLWCVAKLAGLCGLAAAALVVLGEFGTRPLDNVRTLLGLPARALDHPREAS